MLEHCMTFSFLLPNLRHYDADMILSLKSAIPDKTHQAVLVSSGSININVRRLFKQVIYPTVKIIPNPFDVIAINLT